MQYKKQYRPGIVKERLCMVRRPDRILSEDLDRVSMKDSHMLFVLAAILITPFLPFILKGKCPGCGKRKLETIEAAAAGDGREANPFIAYFQCKACQLKFVRERSGPLKALAEDG